MRLLSLLLFAALIAFLNAATRDTTLTKRNYAAIEALLKDEKYLNILINMDGELCSTCGGYRLLEEQDACWYNTSVTLYIYITITFFPSKLSEAAGCPNQEGCT